MRQLQDNTQGWILAAKVGQRTSLMLRYDLLRFPVLMRPYGWRAETPALLGRRAYLHANGCGLLSCSGRLIAQLPAWDSQERTAGNCRMDSLQGRRWYAGLCLPGRSASVKEGDQNSGATVSLSDRRPHRGNFQTEAAAIRQLAGFSWASRREGRYP